MTSRAVHERPRLPTLLSMHRCALLIGWMFLTYRPQYVPATAPLALLLLLDSTYRARMAQPSLLQPLPFWALLAAAVLPRAAVGRHVVPPLQCSTAAGERPARMASKLPWAVVQVPRASAPANPTLLHPASLHPAILQPDA